MWTFPSFPFVGPSERPMYCAKIRHVSTPRTMWTPMSRGSGVPTSSEPIAVATPTRSSRSRTAARASLSEPTGSASRAMAIRSRTLTAGVELPSLRVCTCFVGSVRVAAVLAAALAAAAAAAHPGAGKEPAAPCSSTTVRYTATKVGTPWVAAGRAFTGHGSFSQRLRAVPGKQFPSQLTVPAVGCWRLTLRSGRLSASVVVEAIAPPSGPRCDPTPVFRRTQPHPRFGLITWMQATPRTDGVAAILFVSVVPGADSAVIYAGGRALEGWNTKFLWWSPHPGPGLTIIGRRVDGVGRFQQKFGSASADEGIVFPSIVEIPTAGCWATTVQTGRTAGLIVFQAVVTG